MTLGHPVADRSGSEPAVSAAKSPSGLTIALRGINVPDQRRSESDDTPEQAPDATGFEEKEQCPRSAFKNNVPA